jgi:predicted DNA-binding transcriptional regulator YafY
MRAVEAVEDKFKIDKTIDLVGYLNSCFNMFRGKVETIEIKFVNKLINAIIDRFGKKVNIIDKDDGHFTIRIEAAINEGLVRWVLNWGGDAEIISPANLKHILKFKVIFYT